MNTTTKNLFKKSLLASSIMACLLPNIVMADAAADKAQEKKEVEVIEVTGIRNAWAKSLMSKKDSSVIMETINATDIGKMPDANLAESLQRLPGIQITRSNGEGSSIQIRGMSKNLLLLNNEVMLTGQGQAEGGMASLEEIPSELISEVQVFKAAKADLIEGGMGGTVNVITRSPLQLEGFTLAGNVKAGWGEDSPEEVSPSGAFVIGNNWDDKFGVLLSLTMRDRYRDGFSSENHRTQGYANIPGVNPNPGSDVFDSRADYPEIFALVQSTEDKSRIGSALSFEYKPSDTLGFTFDWVHSEQEKTQSLMKALFHLDRTSTTIEPTTEQHGRVVDYALLNIDRQENQAQVYSTEIDADNFKLGMDWEINDNFRAKLDVSYAKAHELSRAAYIDTMSVLNAQVSRNADEAENPDLRGWLNPSGLSEMQVAWSDTGTGAPSFAVSEDLGNPEYHYYKSAWAQGGGRDSDSDAIKLDFEYDIDAGPLTTVSFGVRSANRTSQYNAWAYLSDMSALGATSSNSHGPFYLYHDAGIADPSLGYSILDTVRFVDLPENYTTYNNFYGLKNMDGNAMNLAGINMQGMTNPETWIGSFYNQPVKTANDPEKKWKVDQRTSAIYLMADFVAEFGDMFLTVNAGARYIQSRIAVHQQTKQTDDLITYISSHSWNGPLDESSFFATTYNNDFNDFLPSISANLEISEDMFIKFAASKTLARQNLDQLASSFGKSYSNTQFVENGVTIERQSFIGGSRGNPELKPDRTTAYDLSYEWYFTDESLVSVALFYKDMTSVVITESRQEEHPDGDGVIRQAASVTSQYNSDGGTVLGAELGLQHVFENGFGFVANYTYSDGEAKGDFDEDGVTKLPLRGLSKHNANLGGFYEKDGLRANLAYNWRSEAIGGYVDYHDVLEADASFTPTYAASYGQLDGSIGYEVTENFTVMAEVTNLLSEDSPHYLGTGAEEQFWNYYEGEARYYVGVAFKL